MSKKIEEENIHFPSQLVGSKAISVKEADNKHLIRKIILLKIKMMGFFYDIYPAKWNHSIFGWSNCFIIKNIVIEMHHTWYTMLIILNNDIGVYKDVLILREI